MIANLNLLSNAIFAVVCFIMGVSFLSLPVPQKDGLHNYRISLRFLAATYIILSLLNIFAMIFDLADNSREYFTFLTIFIASSQALLFAIILINLLSPLFISRRNIFFKVLPIGVFSALYTMSYILFGDPVLSSIHQIEQYLTNPTIWIRLIFLAFFLFQLVFYTKIFLRELRKYNIELSNFFSETYMLRLKWLSIAYFSALAVGIVALISSLLPTYTDWFTTILFTLFYFGFAQEYIKYNKIFSILEPAIAVDPITVVSSIHNEQKRTNWQLCKEQIIVEKFFCQVGININDLAQKLQIGRTTLSNFINREEGVNFNTWINKLRIEESQKLLISNPNFNLVTISEMVGFTEQSNFSRQFKKITGKTPLVWRRSQELV